MDEKDENISGRININENRSTILKWILSGTTAIFLITTIVFICLYANEKKIAKKKKLKIYIMIFPSQMNGKKKKKKVTKLIIKK